MPQGALGRKFTPPPSPTMLPASLPVASIQLYGPARYHCERDA